MTTINGNYPITETKKAKMVEMYKQGIPVTKIAEALSIHPTTVHRNLKRLGVKEPNAEHRKASAHRLSEADRVKIVEMYKAGVLVDEIITDIGCSRPTIYIHVKNAGLMGSRDVPQEQIDTAIQLYIDGKLTIKEITRETGLAKATFYRKLKKYIEHQEG